MNSDSQRKYIVLFLLFLTVTTVLAQTNPPNPNPPPPGLPINAGAIILGILALAYGIVKKK